MESYEVISIISRIFIFLTLSIIGIFINARLFYNSKNENHNEQGKVTQRIIQTYSVTQIVGWPCFMLFVTLIKLDRDFFQSDEPFGYYLHRVCCKILVCCL